MGSPTPPEAPSRRLSPAPANVVLARRFVRSALNGVRPDLVDTAELLAGELATNAVIHARTDFETRAWVSEGRVHVRVSDERPDRGLVPHECHTYACTGRGLTLVEELATNHGAHSGADGKTVWFELWPEAPAPPPSAWETVAPSGPTRTVTLTDVPYALYWAAQQQWEGLLRELLLVAGADGEDGTGPDARSRDLIAAQDMSNVISASMTAAVEQENPDSSTLTLLVAFPRDAAPAVATLRRVLDEADEAAQQGSLLTLPALPQIRSFRNWLLGQIAGQLNGEHPTAWTLVPGAPSSTPTELAPWDASEVEAGSMPTIAADDDNRIIAVNGPAAHLLGWPAQELIGQRLTALMPEHLRPRHTAAFASLLLTGESRILGRWVPVPALHRDGRQIPIRLRIQTQEAIDGRTVFVAQLQARTAPSLAPDLPQGRRETRPVPGPVHLPATTKKAKRGTYDGAAPEWLSLFADTGRAMTSTVGLEEGLRQVCHVLTKWLADWCAVDVLDEHGQVQRVCVVHRDPRVRVGEEHLGRLPGVTESTEGSLPRVLRGAGPLLITDVPPVGHARSPLDARQLALVERLGGDSAVIAPLRAHREVLGALTVVRVQDEHPFTKEDIPPIAELVRGISLGVDSARLHQHTRSTAEHLQRALLPEPPRNDDLQLVARYVPSSTTAEVGGDWYDAFVMPSGDTALVIGDVSGHDLQAAVAMSALRNMLRGLAVDSQEPPGDVLRRLDRVNHTLSPHATATCVYGVIKGDEGGPWALHHSSAGHLPPLLTTGEGETRYLEDGQGLLLGMDPELPRHSACDPLPPGSTLLLFTDGLIERRGESLDDAMTRLRRHTAAHARTPIDVFCDELVLKFGADTTDDIALLALRPTCD
ncbi:PAS domain S-box protein [Streptomyces sp. Ru71]|uniref:SpoIIE family protein phosphatase n=1 Tax=Streptomyces sp. Ru71 TaxID=2080746 RepID=UPI000CDDCCD6|nr:SpoIIE family protein phosphatase [Streptomyces sp. Ru71]POX46845.1 PAS domain S-box protein [Streptomyces sp. Ru71]